MNPTHPSPPAPAAHPTRTVEEWAATKKTPDWQFRAAKVGERWPVGAEKTEADYDAAILKAGSITLR